jgi:[NiFe] hydrogenase assembly HybE family chaperone
MTTADEIAQRLETLYQKVLDERMHDVPIVNGRLEVRAVGVQEWGEYWLCVMLTPWFMNLLLLPKNDSEVDWQNEVVGTKHLVGFPAGQFEFLVSHETAIGRFLMSSLFSPVLEFADQETAEKTAETVVVEIFKRPDADGIDPRDEEMQQIWNGETATDESEQSTQKLRDTDVSSRDETDEGSREVSRRELITGRAKNDERRTA